MTLVNVLELSTPTAVPREELRRKNCSWESLFDQNYQELVAARCIMHGVEASWHDSFVRVYSTAVVYREPNG